MSLPGAELDEVAIQLEDDGSIANDEPHFSGPGFQQALHYGRFEEFYHYLKTKTKREVSLKLFISFSLDITSLRLELKC